MKKEETQMTHTIEKPEALQIIKNYIENSYGDESGRCVALDAIAELEAQLEAIGAGGVEPLRKCGLVQIKELERAPLTDAAISLAAHNIDDGDWNNLVHKNCWHSGFYEGAREAERAHGITQEKQG